VEVGGSSPPRPSSRPWASDSLSATIAPDLVVTVRSPALDRDLTKLLEIHSATARW
jgi:hypothetical protein